MATAGDSELDGLLIQGLDGPELRPDTVGWDRVGFRVDRLAQGARLRREARSSEVALVPLSGSARVAAGGDAWSVGGRASVFAGLPEALYLPRDTEYEVLAESDLELATCSAHAEKRFAPRLVTSSDYSVELRGAGNASRQVATVLPPDFPADRLLVVEVWTPAGNWSSYPPHKHDESTPDEVPLEETYYYRLNPADGFALQRLYSPSRGVDRTFVVGDNDLVAVPWGYHTTAAAPGYDLYYLNVLAGAEHKLAAFEDPQHRWVKGDWRDAAVDPRLPLVGPEALAEAR